MPLGYRHFVVLGDDITPLSQKDFEAVFREPSPGLPAFAGTTVHLVTVVYIVAHRRPTSLVRASSSPIGPPQSRNGIETR